MAISLKRYEPQVGVSAQTGTQPISGGLASSMIQEAGMQDQLIGDAIGALGDVAVDFFEHKAKGEVAKYEAYKQEWANELEVKKQQGLLDGGLSATDLYDKVVVPEQIAFENWVSDQGFSSLAREQIDLDVANFGKKINASERLGLIQRQTEESNYNLQQSAEAKTYEAYQAKKLGNLNEYNRLTEEANQIFNDLKRTTKPGVIEDAQSSIAYGIYNMESATFSNQLKNNQITPNQYIDSINNLIKDIDEDKSIDEKSKLALMGSLTFNVGNAAAQQAQDAEILENKIRLDFATGKMDLGWVDSAIAKYGQENTDLIVNTLQNSLNNVAAENKDIKEIMDLIFTIPTSPTTYIDVLKLAASKGGKYGEELRELSAIIASEYVQTNATLAYEKFGGWEYGIAGIPKETGVAPYNGWVAGVHKEIIESSKYLSEDNYAQTIQDQIAQLIISYNNNPNATPEEVKEIKSKILTGSAINLSQKITAPQQKVLPPKSQKYIEGKIYVDNLGNEARYENGTFVEIK